MIYFTSDVIIEIFNNISIIKLMFFFNIYIDIYGLMKFFIGLLKSILLVLIVCQCNLLTFKNELFIKKVFFFPSQNVLNVKKRLILGFGVT